MDNLFSIGELAKYQNISKQTLIFYDKIGLFKPSYVNPSNGYRYYSAEQLDYLDTILIMKKIGFSLEDIKKHMKTYNVEESLVFLKDQMNSIDEKIQELLLIKSRLNQRCESVEKAYFYADAKVQVGIMEQLYVLYHDVKEPFTMKEISLATKKCYAQAFKENLPIFFQCGVSVPLQNIKENRFIEASIAFVTTDNVNTVKNIKKLPKGLTASIYHFGNYQSIDKSYKILLDYCDENGLKIVSDSYEFCINDYITSRYEDEFITKILFYVEK